MLGQNVGKYRVLERIGRGGMGTVYRALDETLHRDVAIKVLNAELNDPEVARRFRAEAITVARLSHPGIATIYELFQNDDQWLMVMEFVRGETLEHMVDRLGPLSPQRTAELTMQALGALAHAHSMGVVHRDLKPANIMITESGAIKIMDFGIARVAGTEHLTSAGFMMGTPAYMAPEQVMGEEIDARADLYAMGVVFYRLATAKLPFKGDTPFAMAQSQVNDPPTPIGMIRSDLPGWVPQLMGRALAKNREDRFQSANEFQEALGRCLAGLPMRSEHAAAAPTELLLTPPRGSVQQTGPLTGLPPQPSGAQVLPVADIAGRDRPPAPPAFDPMAATVLSASPSGAISTSGPMSGAVIAPGSASGAIPNAGNTAPGPAPAVTPAASSSAEQPIPPASPAAALPAAAALEPAGKSPAARSKGTKSSAPVLAIGGALVLVVVAGAWWFSSRGPAEVPPSESATTKIEATPTGSAEPAAPAAPITDAPTVAAPVQTTPAPPVARPAPTPRPSAPAETQAAPPPAAAPAIDDTPQTFDKARVLIINGRKSDDEEVSLTFGGGRIAALARKGGRGLGAMPYASIRAATYIRDRDPVWDPAFASPPQDLDVGGMLRTTKNWLVLQSADAYLIFRLDDDNARAVVQTLTGRTGVAITYPKPGK
jgi:serine/threonine-protein kinase